MKIEIKTYDEMIKDYYNIFNSNKRYEYIKNFGFVGLCKEFCNDLCNKLQGKKVLSVMSGKGTLEKILMDNGIEVVATDTKEWARGRVYSSWRNEYTDIEEIDAIDAINHYKNWVDIVIMSWPYMDDTAYKVASITKDLNIPLLYIGEDYGGCTASDKFFDLIYNYKQDCSWYNKYFRFPGIHDYPMIINWELETNIL